MENRAHALAVGLFTLLLGAGILIALWWFAGSGEEFKKYRLVSPHSVGNLNPQAAVRFRGVRVGRVLSVELAEDDPGKVIVTIRVRSDVPVTAGTTASLASQGITGMSYIQLEDAGQNPQALVSQDGEPPQIALSPGLMQQVTETGKEILGELRIASTRINQLLSPQNIERLDASLKNLAASTQHLEKTLQQTPELVSDLRRFASPDNAAQLKSAMTNLNAVSKQLGPAVEDWRRTLARYEAAGGRIERLATDLQGSVAADTLPRINQLASDLQTASSQLNQVLLEFERTPQMIVFGRQPTAAGPGETPPQGTR